MNARQVVEEDIKIFSKKALKNGILINPRMSGDFFKNKNEISSKYSRFSDEEDYLMRYNKQYEDGEFFAAFEDGAFLQINYEFNIQSRNISYVSKMNLCFLPSVVDNRMEHEYIRIDYNDSDDNSFFHTFAHMHIGFKNKFRLPLEDVFLFSDFLRIILYLYYPNNFNSLFSGTYKVSNTIKKGLYGTVTKEHVLTDEVQENIYLKFKK